MAVEKGINPFSFPADADLSARQYRLVNFSTDGQIAAAANTATFVAGILQNDPAAATRAASVQTIAGTVSKVEVTTTATGALLIGSLLTSAANGVAKLSTGGVSYQIGRSLEVVSTGVAAGARTISMMITHEGIA
jgi:hypothetical protein